MTSKVQQFNYVTYGTTTNAERVVQLLEHVANQYLEGEATTGVDAAVLSRPTPVCIWGMHGIGKTELVGAFAKSRGYRFVYIAPAQFEEMGDLLGMPKIEGTGTRFIAPEWAPKEEGPGIFLIDDVNRADERILRGIMQLLQNYELVSWKLPARWMILLTANPDGGDYSVSTMDDAMLTRMMHVTMEFDVKAWAKWAEQAGIDPRGVNFVLTYPEIVSGNRTTPRSLVQFFRSLTQIADLKQQLDLVKLLADGCLNVETTVAFISFINMDMDKIVAPEELIDAPLFSVVEARVKELVDGKTKRMDILSVIMTRLTNYLLFRKEELNEKGFENLKRFILLSFIPNDLRLAMAQELVNAPSKSLKKLYGIPEIAKLILTKM